MTYGRAAAIGAGMALLMEFAAAGHETGPEKEPAQVQDKNTYVVQAGDDEGLWGIADKCTSNPAELKIVWLALVDEYGDDFIANTNEPVDVPDAEGATVDCVANSSL